MKILRIAAKVIAYGSVFYCYTEYGVEAVVCEGPSMKPTIMANDVLLAEHVSVMLHNVQRNDIVICANPNQPSKLLCKRVKAIEGDSVNRSQVIPRGHVWLEGDNVRNSLDSSAFGPVPYALIRSRVVLKIWPLDQFGWMSSHWFYEKPPDVSNI